MDLGSFLIGNMLVSRFAIENMDHLIASHVAERMASWLLWIAELGHSISSLLDLFARSMRIIDIYHA